MKRGSSHGRLYLLFFFSGAAALGAQMAWMQILSAGLGHEVSAMLAVVVAFLGGMAAGAALLGRRLATTLRPALWYGVLELSISVWTVLAALFVPWVNDLALRLAGPAPSFVRQWTVAFLLPFLLLLPATAPMGAALPAMERLLSVSGVGRRCIGGLYAANTFGAVAGILGSVFLLMPSLGFRGCLFSLAMLSLLSGVVALAWRKEIDSEAAEAVPFGKASKPKPIAATAEFSLKRICITAFFTGCLGLGFELIGIRILSQVLENTLFTYAASLSVFLFGTALGGALYQRLAPNRPFRTVLTWLLGTTAVTCLLSTYASHLLYPFYDICRGLLGDEMPAVVLAEMITAGLMFGPPTTAMGATFSHLLEGARSRPGGVGWASALNTIGCSAAAVLFGVLVLPRLGIGGSMLILAFGYLALLPGFRGGAWYSVTAVVALAIFVPGNIARKEIYPGAIVRDHREGVMASVSVIQTPDGHRSLRVNNRLQMGGTAAAQAERRQAHIPLLLHPEPRHALFLGPGTGITLGAAEAYPELVSEGVELVPEIRDMMHFFEPENGGPFPRPGLQVHVADARRFIRARTNRYDVIVADLFHPAQDGAGFLYTRNHFQMIRQRLERGGLFCQWLPLHQLDQPTLRMIVRTFLETFSDAHAFLLHFNVDVPVLALVGAPDGLRVSLDDLERRLKAIQPQLRDVGLERSLNLLGSFAAGPDQLRAFAGDASVGSDDWPGVLFSAPRFAVRRQAPAPHELLVSFLQACRVGEREVASLIGAREDGYPSHLTSFIAARDIYLRGLVEEGQGRLPSAIDLYLESARKSLYFIPGYARCISIIQVLANTDEAQARRLYGRLEEAQPGQPLARNLFGTKFGIERSAGN